VSGGRESFGSVDAHAGQGARVDCYTYAATTPILSVYAGRLCVSISIADRTVIPAHAVAFARELAAQAGVFAAECERLHAVQQGQAPANGEASSAG